MMTIREMLFARIAKRHAIAKLVAQGKDESEAEAAVNQAVSDAEVVQDAKEQVLVKASDGSHPVLDFLRSIVDWFSDPANQAKLEGIIAFILKMVALLAPLFAAKSGQPAKA
jgi:hypothetical protein